MPYSKEEVLSEVERVSKSKCGGDSPTWRDMIEYGDIHPETCSSYFDGEWNNVLKKLDKEVNLEKKCEEYTYQEHIENINIYFSETGDIPTTKEYKEYFDISPGKSISEPGWKKLLHSSEIPHKRIEDKYRSGCEKEELDETITQLSEVNEFLSLNEFCRITEHTENDIYYNYGTWESTLEDFDLKCASERSGEDHPLWKNGHREYGENWYRQRERCLKRDNFQCRICGNVTSNHSVPDVHHIKPLRTFDVPEEANNLSNLICLCRYCHKQVEGKWTQLDSDEFEEVATEHIDFYRDSDESSLYGY